MDQVRCSARPGAASVSVVTSAEGLRMDAAWVPVVPSAEEWLVNDWVSPRRSVIRATWPPLANRYWLPEASISVQVPLASWVSTSGLPAGDADGRPAPL